MKIKRRHLEVLGFLIVYCFVLFSWSLPYHSLQELYGEWDAISHWMIPKYVLDNDATFHKLPPFIASRYSGDNRLAPGTLWYHPPFHTNLAIAGAFSSNHEVAVLLTNTIFASAIVITVFFVIKKLFGYIEALLSSLLVGFSLRNLMPYIWGQWPERLGYAFLPLALYFFYKYYTSFIEKQTKPMYLYIMMLILGVNLMVHPLTFFHTLAALATLGVFLLLKYKKIPFNIKHIGIAIGVFILFFGAFPFQTGSMILQFMEPPVTYEQDFTINRFFQWSLNPEDFSGSVPPSYFSFDIMHGNWQALSSFGFLPPAIRTANLHLILLFIALIVLTIRAIALKRNQDLFLLAWLISLYLVLHRDAIGKIKFLHRSLAASSHIFAPILVVGVLSIPQLLPIKKSAKKIIKLLLAALLLIMILQFNVPPVVQTLSGAYASPIIRLNDAEIKAGGWLRENLELNENATLLVTPNELIKKTRWLSSYAHVTINYLEIDHIKPDATEIHRTYKEKRLENDYLIFDYTDLILVRDQNGINIWQNFEAQIMPTHEVVYNDKVIKIYKPVKNETTA